MTNFKSATLAAFLVLASAPLALTLVSTEAVARGGGNGGGGGGGAGGGAGGNSNDGIYDLINFDAQKKQTRTPNDPPRGQTYVVNQCGEGRAIVNRAGRTIKFGCHAPRY